MVKTQESNRDHKEGDPTRIHWAKFSMMGRFVSITSQCQNQCRSSTDYNFPDRPHIRDLFYKRTVMSPEVCFVSLGVSSHNPPLSNSCKECASKIQMTQMLNPPANFSFGDIHASAILGSLVCPSSFIFHSLFSPHICSFLSEILVNAPVLHYLYNKSL